MCGDTGILQQQLLVFITIRHHVFEMEYQPKLKAGIAHAKAKIVILLAKLGHLRKHLLLPVVTVYDYPKLIILLDVIFIDECLQLSVDVGRTGVIILSVQYYELHIGGT